MLRYAITDRHLLALDQREARSRLLAQAARLAAQRIDFLQLREKDLPPAPLAELARDLLQVLRPSPLAPSHTRLLVHSHIDLALLIGADGVHITFGSLFTPNSLTPLRIRSDFHAAGRPDPFISLSCHTVAEIEQARPHGVSAILFGPVFGKSVRGEQVQPGIGLQLLAEACHAASPIPVLALGGITDDNTPSCLAAGAAGIAAIRLFL